MIDVAHRDVEQRPFVLAPLHRDRQAGDDVEALTGALHAVDRRPEVAGLEVSFVDRKAVKCIRRFGDVQETSVEIELHDPAYGIAPGKAAVIYDGTRVVGSATIASTRRVHA